MEIDASLPKTCALDSAQDSQSTGEPHRELNSASQETRDGETCSSSKAPCSLEMDTSDKDQENHKHEIALDSAQDSQSTGEPHHEQIHKADEQISQETSDGETQLCSKASCSPETEAPEKDQENHKHELESSADCQGNTPEGSERREAATTTVGQVSSSMCPEVNPSAPEMGTEICEPDSLGDASRKGVSENAANQSTEKPLQEDSSCQTSALREKKGGERGQGDSSPKSKTGLVEGTDTQSTQPPLQQKDWASREGSACPKVKDAENVQVDSDRKDKSISCKQDIDKEIQQGSDQRNKSALDSAQDSQSTGEPHHEQIHKADEQISQETSDGETQLCSKASCSPETEAPEKDQENHKHELESSADCQGNTPEGSERREAATTTVGQVSSSMCPEVNPSAPEMGTEICEPDSLGDASRKGVSENAANQSTEKPLQEDSSCQTSALREKKGGERGQGDSSPKSKTGLVEGTDTQSTQPPLQQKDWASREGSACPKVKDAENVQVDSDRKDKSISCKQDIDKEIQQGSDQRNKSALDSAQDSQSTGEPHHEQIHKADEQISQETSDGETQLCSKASCSPETEAPEKDQENHKHELESSADCQGNTPEGSERREAATTTVGQVSSSMCPEVNPSAPEMGTEICEPDSLGDASRKGVSENAANQSTEKPLQEDSSCQTSALREKKGGERGQGDSSPKSKTALDSAQDSQSTGEPHHEQIHKADEQISQETSDGETQLCSKASCSPETEAPEKDQENHKHELESSADCQGNTPEGSERREAATTTVGQVSSSMCPEVNPSAPEMGTEICEPDSLGDASRKGVSENAANQSTEKPLQEDSSCQTSALREKKGGERGQGDSSPKSKTGLVEGTDTQSTQPPLQQKDWASREGSACPKVKDAENVQVDSDRKDKSISCKQDIDKEIQQGSDQRNKSGNSVVDTASQPFLPEVSAVVDKSDVRRRKEKVAEKDQNDSFRKETTDKKRPTHPKITSEPADEKNKTMIPQGHGDNQQSYNSALPQLSPFLAVLLVLLVGAGLWLFKWPHQSQSAEKGENRSIEVFRRQITRLESSFPSQRKELWRRSRIHMEKHLQSEEPTEPVSMILTAGRKAERTLHCLASGLARAYSSALNASALHIDGLSKATLDSDRIKLEIDEELTAAFEGNKRAAVIHRFEELPPDSTLIFYKYCDHENAAYKAVSLIFTVLLEEDELGTQLNLGSVEEMVQDHIQEKFFISVQPTVFDKMDTDKFSGLWSRISHLILPVSTEERSERLGCDL
ncbi:dentin sialophosphoprotein-like isoform X4 [Lepisosteus oculatus]|uniref:dentin sialophosphoprotein-like isoform X4 n=1 Tax=Lepisosteus oculatus TaxID=7918 RepID=UPI003710BDB2